jgi:hypothetical protein
MNKKMALSLGIGLLAFGSQGLISSVYPGSPFLTTIAGAASALIAGLMHASARGFFAGMLISIGCWLLPGLFGTDYDRYKAVIAGPLIVAWALGVAAVSFLLGRLLAMAAIWVRQKLGGDTAA